jgi:hypothetical protein
VSTFPQQNFAPQQFPAPQQLPGVGDLGGLPGVGGQFAPPPMPQQFNQAPQQQYQDPVMANFPPQVQAQISPAIPAEQLQQNGMQQQFHQPQMPQDFGPQPNYQQPQQFGPAPQQPPLPQQNFTAPPVPGYQQALAPEPAASEGGKLNAKELAAKVKSGEFDHQLDALWSSDERQTVRKAVEDRKASLSGVPAPAAPTQQLTAPAPGNPATTPGMELCVYVPVPISKLQAVLATL